MRHIDSPEVISRRRESKIKRMAYEIWEELGKPEGQSLEIWLKAEEMYEGQRKRFNVPLKESALPEYGDIGDIGGSGMPKRFLFSSEENKKKLKELMDKRRSEAVSDGECNEKEKGTD